MARGKRPRKRPAGKARKFFVPPAAEPKRPAATGDRPGRKVLAAVARKRPAPAPPGRAFFTPPPPKPPERRGIIGPGGTWVQDFQEEPDGFMIVEGGREADGSQAFYIERHRMRPGLDELCSEDPADDPRVTHWAVSSPQDSYCRICQSTTCRGVRIADKLRALQVDRVRGGLRVFQKLLGLDTQEPLPF